MTGLAVHNSSVQKYTEKSSRALLAQPALPYDRSLMQHFPQNLEIS